jgi:hypothetical protein
VLIGARSAAEISDAIGLRAIGIPPDLWPALAADSAAGELGRQKSP